MKRGQNEMRGTEKKEEMSGKGGTGDKSNRKEEWKGQERKEKEK